MPRPRDDGTKQRSTTWQASHKPSYDLGDFEILGPVMSSVPVHRTRRRPALRPGFAASLLEGRITKVTFGLWNPFCPYLPRPRHRPCARRGHPGPPDTDDENIKQAFDLCARAGPRISL